MTSAIKLKLVLTSKAGDHQNYALNGFALLYNNSPLDLTTATVTCNMTPPAGVRMTDIIGSNNYWQVNPDGLNGGGAVEIDFLFTDQVEFDAYKLCGKISDVNGDTLTGWKLSASTDGNTFEVVHEEQNYEWADGVASAFWTADNKPATKKICLKIEGDKKPWMAKTLQLFDIDDNNIPVFAVVSSDGVNDSDLLSSTVFNSANSSTIVVFEVAATAKELNYLTLQAVSKVQPIKRVSLLVDKVGDGNPLIPANFTTLKSTTVVSVASNGSATIRIGLTKTALAESVKINAIKLKTKLGQQTSVVDVLSLLMTTTTEGESANTIMSNGGGYDELRTAGLTDTEALIALSVINLQVDSARYESEQALKAITASIAALSDFVTYITGHGKTITSFSNIASDIRANTSLYMELRGWHSQYAG